MIDAAAVHEIPRCRATRKSPPSPPSRKPATAADAARVADESKEG